MDENWSLVTNQLPLPPLQGTSLHSSYEALRYESDDHNLMLARVGVKLSIHIQDQIPKVRLLKCFI